MTHTDKIAFRLPSITLVFLAFVTVIGNLNAQEAGSNPDPTLESNGTVPNSPGISAAADLTIRTIRDLDPNTPVEILRAIEALLNVKQPTVASEYIKKLVDSNPTDAQLAKVYDIIGPALFLRLTREKGLSPEAAVFARRVLAASHKAVTDPKRIQGLLGDLSSADEAVRAAALTGVAEAGEASVGYLLPLLDASRGKPEYDHLRNALKILGRDAHGPLLGALTSTDAKIQAAAIRGLGDLGVQTSIPFLCRPALLGVTPDVQIAANATILRLGGRPAGSNGSNTNLAKIAQRMLRNGFPDPRERMIKVWSWDSETNRPSYRKMQPEVAAAFFAAWIASDLYAIAPNDDHERLWITTQLAAAKMTGGLDVPIRVSDPMIFQKLAQLPIDRFETVLDAELGKNEPAAIGAAEMIGHLRGDPFPSLTDRAEGSLAKALKHGDPRIRFTAVASIVQKDPLDEYNGAANFWQQLRWFASTEGTRRILVVHSRASQADNLAGMATELGFTALAVGNHQSAMKAAKSHADYEAILVSDSVELWTELLQQIRRDPQTARLPVGLIVRSDALQDAESLARVDPLTIAYPLPYDSTNLGIVLQNTLSQESVSKIDVQTRMEFGKKAIGWLADMVADHPTYSFYNILDAERTLIQALSVPEFAPRAAAALGALGTPDSQRALVDLASSSTRPIELRQAAAEAFRLAILRQGVQLTQKRVMVQYDRYNASEKLDESTQEVLGSLLDSIELAANRTPMFKETDTP